MKFRGNRNNFILYFYCEIKFFLNILDRYECDKFTLYIVVDVFFYSMKMFLIYNKGSVVSFIIFVFLYYGMNFFVVFKIKYYLRYLIWYYFYFFVSCLYEFFLKIVYFNKKYFGRESGNGGVII